MAPANHIQAAASWLATAAQPTKWYGQRQRRNDLPAHLAPNSFVVNSNLSEAWVNSAGRSNISSIFQHGLQDGYLSLNPHVKGGLFPLTDYPISWLHWCCAGFRGNTTAPGEVLNRSMVKSSQNGPLVLMTFDGAQLTQSSFSQTDPW